MAALASISCQSKINFHSRWKTVIPFSWRIFALFSNFFFGIKRFQGNVYFLWKRIKIVNLPFLTYTVTLINNRQNLYCKSGRREEGEVTSRNLTLRTFSFLSSAANSVSTSLEFAAFNSGPYAKHSNT